METGLAADKRAISDKEMSPSLELGPCHSERCAARSVWHRVQLMDVGGFLWPAACHIPSLTASFQSWARLSFSALQMSWAWQPQECAIGRWPCADASAENSPLLSIGACTEAEGWTHWLAQNPLPVTNGELVWDLID